MTLDERLNKRFRASSSGIVHRIYLCTCGGAHLWCRGQFTRGEVVDDEEAVTCKHCLSGGSAWASFVAKSAHVELLLRDPEFRQTIGLAE